MNAQATQRPRSANATTAYRTWPDVAPLEHLAGVAGAIGQMNTRNVLEGKPATAGAEPSVSLSSTDSPIKSNANQRHVCHTCAAFLLFGAAPNRPS